MKALTAYRMCFLIGSFFLLTQLLWSQQETDSALVFATKQIYENPDNSIATALQVFNAAKTSTDIKVQALIIVSTAYSSKREYEKSLEYSLKAMDLFPKINDPQIKIKLLNRIGGQYQELNVYDKAMTYLEEAYKLTESLPESDAKARNMGFNNLVRGFIYREQMSCEIALEYFDRAIEAYTKVLSLANVNSNMSTAYYNRGNCLLTINRKKEAEDSFLQAIEYAKKTNAKSLIAFAKKGLAEVYTTEGDNGKAIILLTDALQNSEEVGDKVLNRAIYNALSTNYLAINDIKNYSLYTQKNRTINKEITQTERKTINTSIQNLMNNNSEKAEDFENRILIYWLLLSFFIIIAIALIARTIYKSEKTLKVLKTKLNF